MPRQVNSDVSFGSGVLLTGIISLSMMALINTINAKPMLESNKDKVELTSGWQPNLRVLSSVGQNVITYATDSVEYTSRLLGQLDSFNISTLEEANESLSKNGYKAVSSSKDKNIMSTIRGFVGGDLFSDEVALHKTFHSLQSPGPQLGIFNKKEQNKDRFVVIFHQNDVPLASSISAKFYSKIKKTYGLDSPNILYLGINSLDDFSKGIDSVSKKIDSLDDKSKAELLVFYSGHGNADALNDSANGIEGAMEGRLKTQKNIKETQVKKLFGEKLKETKTLFIIDACHSGAWISENTKAAAKLSRLA